MNMSSSLFVQTMGVLWLQLLLFILVIVGYKKPIRFGGWTIMGLIVVQFLFLWAIFVSYASIPLSLFWMTLFTILNGILVAPAYRSMSKDHVIMALVSTATIFLLMTLYAIAAYRSGFVLLGWIHYLQYGLLALLIAMLANIGLSLAGFHYRAFQHMLSIAGILLFSVFIIHDVQLIEKNASSRIRQNPVLYALTLFLDLLNLFNFISSPSNG